MNRAGDAPDNSIRILVTLGTLILFGVGHTIPLIGLELGELDFERSFLERLVQLRSFSMGASGVRPIVSAFLIVEVAAWVIPPWRKLRNDSERGRRALDRAAWTVACLTSAVQGVALGMALNSQAGLGISAPLGGVLISLVGWTALLLVAAHFAGRFGALGGIQTLVLGDLLFEVLFVLPASEEVPPSLLLHVTFAFFAAVALIGDGWPSLRGAARESNSQARALPTRWILAGVLPLTFALSAWNFPSKIKPGFAEGGAARNFLERLDTMPWWTFAVVIAAVLFFGFMFSERALLSRLDEKLGLGPAVASVERGRFTRALGLSLVFAIVAWGAALGLWYQGESISLAAFALTAIVLDGVAHLSFRARHRDAVTVFRSNFVYVAQRVRDALQARGIGAHLKGLRHRSLLHFFGPHLPIEILVPAADAAAASELLAELTEKGLPEPGRGKATK